MAALDANGTFAVNLWSRTTGTTPRTFAGRPRVGRPFDFASHDWTEGATGLPLVTDATAVFECATHSSLDAGTHRIYIGRVIGTRCGDAEPLVYCNRAFRRIVNHEGV